MQDTEQVAICKAIARSCMWGHGGIASVIVERIAKTVAAPEDWGKVFRENKRAAEYEAVGIITDRAELDRLLACGHYCCNYRHGELAVFNPPPMNGLYKYIIGSLADEYGERYDSWNYRIYQNRVAEAAR